MCSGVRIILGGTHVHNARSFIDEVIHATGTGARDQASDQSHKKRPLM
jgi:hypothetical protein